MEPPTTADWVAAIGAWVGGLGTIGALVVAAYVLRDQLRALRKTTEALDDEMRHRREERQRERASQASGVRFGPGPPLPKMEGPGARNALLLDDSGEVESVGAHLGTLEPLGPYAVTRFQVTNDSNGRITDVAAAEDDTASTPCHVAALNGAVTEGSVPVLLPGQSARFYWPGPVDELSTYLEFTDEAGNRWRLHNRDGLSEVTRREGPSPTPDQQ